MPEPGNPQTLNRYSYALNNPLRYNDPSGHVQQCMEGDLGGGCGAGSTAESIYDTFDEEHGGQYGGLFAEYYASLYVEDQARAWNDPNLGSYEQATLATLQRAQAWVPQERFDFWAAASSEGVTFAVKVSSSVGTAGVAVANVPSPNGRRGGPAHQAKIADIQTDIVNRGLKPRTEFGVDTPGGTKSERFVDVAALGPDGNPVEFHQVGKVNLNDFPVMRELRAIFDLLDYGEWPDVPLYFHPYNIP